MECALLRRDAPFTPGDGLAFASASAIEPAAPVVIDVRTLAEHSAAAGGALSGAETQRYGRQLILAEVGVQGQLALRRARVLVVGAGGLGSPALLYLAAAGVGTLGVVEHDSVESSNLQRQILFDMDAVGRRKIDAAAVRLQALNPNVAIEAHAVRLAADNALDLIGRYDIVVDATDNFAARYLINDACVVLDKPNVSASILRFEGQLSVFWPLRGPCYRCLYPLPPPPELAPSCAEAGVLGVLPGIFGTLQANEVIKLILGAGQTLVGRLLLLDALAMEFKALQIARDPQCPACARRAQRGEYFRSQHLIQKEADPAAASVAEMTPVELHRQLLSATPPYVIDVRSAAEHRIASLARSTLIPLDELGSRSREIPAGGAIVCICHKGSRSRRAAQQLQAGGRTEVYSLGGGIDAWSRDVDASIPRY